jgi:hypothetical protein
VLKVRLTAGGTLPAAARGAFGQGRVAYLPGVVPAVAPPAPESGLTVGGGGFTNKYWKLPKNSEEIVAAIRHAAGAPFPVEFERAPLTTVMELTDKKDGSARVFHWINYKLGAVVKPAKVSVAIPEGRKVTSVELLSPDRPGAQNLPYTHAGNRVRLTLPALEVYHVAVIHLSQ